MKKVLGFKILDYKFRGYDEFQYEVGKEYSKDRGDGLFFCTEPLTVLNYTFDGWEWDRYVIVLATGIRRRKLLPGIVYHASKLEILKEISFIDLVNFHVGKIDDKEILEYINYLKKHPNKYMYT